MPGLEEEVDRVLKPPAAPHYRKNFTAETKAVRMEISRHKSLQMASISTAKTPRRPVASSSPWSPAVSAPALPHSNSSSDVEFVEPNSSNGAHRPSHNKLEAKRHGKRTRQPTAQHPAVHTSSPRPSSPISASDFSWRGSSPELSIETTRHNKHARNSTAQHFPPHSSPFPSSPISLSDSSWCDPSPLSASLSISSSSATHVYLPARSRSVSLEQSSMPSSSSAPLSACTQSTSSKRSQHPPASVREIKKRSSKVYWYTGLHCVEVVDGVAKMASCEATGLTKAERFAFAFGPDRPYNERTFQDAEKQWRLATPEDREDAIQLGLSPAGLWKAFSKKHPLKNRRNAKAATADSDND